MKLTLSRRNAVFLANFGASKLLVFTLPLLLAGYASDRLYGSFEFGLALGLQLSALLIGAPLAGITQLHLIHKQQDFVRLLAALTFVPALLSLLSASTLYWAGAHPQTILTTAAIALTVIQNTASTWLRARGMRNATAWVDGSSLLAGSVAIGLTAILTKGDDIAFAANIFIALSALTVLASGFIIVQRQNERTIAPFRRAVGIGFPMMVAGLFATWIGVSGRILLGFFNASELAAYSIAFRICALALGVHQLATTAAFPRLYASRVRPGDKLLASFFALALAACALLSLAAPFVPQFIGFRALTAEGAKQFAQLVPIASLQTFLWIGFALLQMRVSRFGSAKASVFPLTLCTIAGLMVIVSIIQLVPATAVLVTWLTTLHSAAYFTVMWWILARRRVPHPKTGLVGVGGGFGLLLIAILS